MQKKIILTGIKPTGSPHIGNYIGAIKPALRLVQDYPDCVAMFFIADYHAMTLIRDRDEFRELCYEVAATWLSLGLDPDKVIFYRQSDIPEVFELNWILACSISKGLMNRAHAYKAIVAQNQDKGSTDDEGVNMGLYSYPILMAADILLFQSDLVPVGRDQKQHVEIARDIAVSFNYTYANIFKLPEYVIDPTTADIPGLDGRKMSKSYKNTIPIFTPSDELRNLIFRIKTDSSAPDAPKNPDTSTLFLIYKEFTSSEHVKSMRSHYVQGNISWAGAKQELFNVLDNFLVKPRRIYQDLIEDRTRIDAYLAQGAEKARALAAPLMVAVRKAIGRT